MAASSTLSSKGQLTIPVEVRTRLGLRAGDRVEFVFEGGHTVIRPLRSEENPFDKYVGILPAFADMEEINASIREMRGGGPEFPD